MDSLGSRHPQAQKVLRYWLKAEAKDKRQTDEVRIAEVKLQKRNFQCSAAGPVTTR